MVADPTVLVARLREAFSAPAYQPPVLPAVALELHGLVREGSASAARVRELIEREPLLAGKVLQLAQSPAYAGRVVVRSIEDAVVRLGTSALSSLFLKIAVQARVFRAPGYAEPMRALARHSAVTAELARWVCRQTSFPEDAAFLCGLLHDAGAAAALLLLADVQRGKSPPAYAAVLPAVRSVHEDATLALARGWALSPDLGLVLARHHDFVREGRPHPLAAVLCVADHAATLAGAAALDETADAAADAARHLALSRRVVDELRRLADRVVAVEDGAAP